MIRKNFRTIRGDSITFGINLTKGGAPYADPTATIQAVVWKGGIPVQEFELVPREADGSYIVNLSGEKTAKMRGSYEWSLKLTSLSKNVTFIGGELFVGGIT